MKTNLTSAYTKHNSFVDLRVRTKNIVSEAELKCKNLLSGLETFAKPNQFEIIKKAIQDIENPGSDKNSFKITPNVAAEIAFLEGEELARYLFHRYRYEIFPAKKKLDEYPPYLQIEPSSICNYRCIFCFESDPSFTKPSNGFMGKMKFDLFREIIDQAVGNIEFISLASRGEPLACKDIEQMLAYTPGKFLNLKMNTNASLMDESKCHAILQSGIRTLVFSADAAEEPLYSQLRVNGKLERVLENIKTFQKIKVKHYPHRKIITRVSGVKVKQEQNMQSMEKLWGDLVDQVAFVNYNPWENVYEASANGISTPCSDLWRRMFIWWDGKTNPCDVDYKSNLSVGTICNQTIKNLWSSQAYEVLRASHLSGSRQKSHPCKNCVLV